MSPTSQTTPKVFISYSHDSAAHRQRVLEFSERLRADGVDTRIDQYSPWPEEGWPRWMARHIREADFVLMVCTETYTRRVSGQEDPGIGRGVCWEANLIYNHLYSARAESAKFIPLVFERGDTKHIPDVLEGHTHFRVYTDDGYEDLYRLLTNQPRTKAGPIGPLVKLPELQSRKDSLLSPTQAPDASSDGEIEEGQKKFFISYPQGDADEENLARSLHAILTDAGHEAFIDIGMATGTDWIAEITNRIKWCDFLVVLLSERSMASEMVHTEVRLAHLRRGDVGSPKIVPVRVRYFGPLEYELDLYLGSLQYVKWSGPEDSQRVQQEVLRATDSVPVDEAEAMVRLTSPRDPRPVAGDQRPQPTQDTRAAAVPGGTIRSDDPCYISRPQDEAVKNHAADVGQTLVIKGPRQIGKSSLLLQYLGECQQAGKKVAFIDFQIFSSEDLANYTTFLSRFALIIQYRLAIDGESPNIDSQFAMVQFMEQAILPAANGPLVVALDEVDRLLGRPYQSDFFSMLRLWHNNRSPLTPQWEDLDLALVISTEPYLLIAADNRSPFNVGLLVQPETFTKANCQELDGRFPGVLTSQQVEELWNLLRGHPFLTRLSYYRLTAADAVGFDELIERADDERGPFGDHLRALLMKLDQTPDLLAAMKQVIRDGTVPHRDLYYRLFGAGLVQRDVDRINPANLLYARYFRKAL